MTDYSYLPNAAHIDRIIASVKAHSDVWYAARAAVRNEAWNEAWNEAGDERWDADRTDAAWNTAWDERWDADRTDAAWNTAWDAALGAILALIAYDDAAKYLEMKSDELKIWAELSEDPAAILLLPAVIAFEKINDLETA